MSPDPLALIQTAYAEIDRWERSFGEAPTPPALRVDDDVLGEALDEYLGRLTAPPRGEAPGMYPFGHPRYAGQMLKPPHPVALAAYAAAARINPNNHALDGGPPTSAMEKEVVADLARMFGLPPSALGHLTGGGTVANLEALFVAREETGGAAVAHSAEAHYTHARVAYVLGVESVSVASDDAGRIDLDALEDALKRGGVGDRRPDGGDDRPGRGRPDCGGGPAVPPLRRARACGRGLRRVLHALLAAPPSGNGGGAGEDAASRVPYGCRRRGRGWGSRASPPGTSARSPRPTRSWSTRTSTGSSRTGAGRSSSATPAVGRHYRHDSPYTYFTSSALHLGEISLECSRPGAAAGALWLTLRVLPLEADRGLGPVVAAGLRAARALAGRLEASEAYDLVLPPETDIVVYAPRAGSVSETDARSGAVFEAGMADPDDPLFLSLYRLSVERLTARLPALARDGDHARVLRSVLMKPEHEGAVGWIADRLERLGAGWGSAG